jgi:hypothetical protein
MGTLTGIFGAVAAFITGFVGHVVAHDFCEVAPMLSKKLIEFAASYLPRSIRDRYLEEWRADLQAQPGTVAKLAWSLWVPEIVIPAASASSHRQNKKNDLSVRFVHWGSGCSERLHPGFSP